MPHQHRNEVAVDPRRPPMVLARLLGPGFHRLGIALAGGFIVTAIGLGWQIDGRRSPSGLMTASQQAQTREGTVEAYSAAEGLARLSRSSQAIAGNRRSDFLGSIEGGHADRGGGLVERANLARFLAARYSLAVEHMQEFVDIAYRVGGEVRLDPLLLLAVAGIESGFDPSAQSKQGAQGLMQVLTRVNSERFTPFGGAAAAFDPLANMRVGAQILRDFLARVGSIEGALKAYVGAAALPDDRGYGAKVLSERDRLAVAAGQPVGKALPPPPVSPTVDLPGSGIFAPEMQASGERSGTVSVSAAEVGSAALASAHERTD